MRARLLRGQLTTFMCETLNITISHWDECEVCATCVTVLAFPWAKWSPDSQSPVSNIQTTTYRQHTDRVMNIRGWHLHSGTGHAVKPPASVRVLWVD